MYSLEKPDINQNKTKIKISNQLMIIIAIQRILDAIQRILVKIVIYFRRVEHF